MTEKTIILIDGENFRHSVRNILTKESLNPGEYDYESIRLRKLLEEVFASHKNIKVTEIRYYAAKMHVYPENEKESKQKVAKQRKLKTNLEKQDLKFIVKGNVRRRELTVRNHTEYDFVEKGVDVGIAVDMVVLACDKTVSTIILCSSDSDLQPAVKEARRRNIKVIYLGFSINPNKGLQVTTSESVLFRNQEIIDAITRRKK